MKAAMQILKAMNELGDDIVDQAELIRVDIPLWKKMTPVAACLMIIVGIGALIRSLPFTELQVPTDLQQFEISTENHETAKPENEEQPFKEWQWQQETPPCYTLPLENGGYVAVNTDGTIILEVDEGTLSLLIDEANGEALGICHVMHPENPDKEKTVTVLYDLRGKLLKRIYAWSIQVLGNVVLVNEEYEKYTLYRLSEDGVSVLMENLGVSIVTRNSVATQLEDGSATIFWDRYGNKIKTVWQTAYWCAEWNGTAYYEIFDSYSDTDGKWCTSNHGIIDDNGNQVIPPKYERITDLANGYVSCFDGVSYSLFDLEASDVVASINADQGVIIGAYDKLLFISKDDNPRDAELALFWDGTPVVDEFEIVHIVDDEGDGVAELIQVTDGNKTYWYLPDGSLLQAVDCMAQTITSRTALLMENPVSLLNLQTGQIVALPDKGYSTAVALWPFTGSEDYATGVFFATYTDVDGHSRTDIFREDGVLLLEDYAKDPSKYGYVGEKYGIFKVKGGYKRIDGVWIYQEEHDSKTVRTIDMSDFSAAISELAFMDYDNASEDQKIEIEYARKQIIFSTAWVADDLNGRIYDESGTVIENVPEFHELFPDEWEIP